MNTELKVSNHLHGFARRLVAEGLMEEKAALEAVDLAGKKGNTILAWTIRENGVDPDLLAAAASIEYGVPIIDINSFDLGAAPISLVMND